jgi:transcriptional regulator with XRE-family HTH domain
MSVGTNLKKLRSKTKYSQQDIADMLNVDRLTYINWENETTEVKSGYIRKLADIFGVKIEELFESSGNSIISINNDNASGNLNHGIIINLSDKETAEKLSEQIQELIKSLKK